MMNRATTLTTIAAIAVGALGSGAFAQSDGEGTWTTRTIRPSADGDGTYVIQIDDSKEAPRPARTSVSSSKPTATPTDTREPTVVRGSGTSSATKDSEQIIDVEQITKTVRESTEPLYKSLEDTRLKERFEKVKKLLAAGDVDRDELLRSLRDLKGGIDTFTGKWESIVDPLWAGQEALAKAIDDIRKKVPADADGEMPEKITKLLESYDERLTDLANRIKQAPEGQRRKRLKKVFENVLSLRQFTERLGRSGIHKVKIKLMLRTVQILSRLQDQLLDATFELEKVRSILSSESDFINDYVELLQMAKTANDLLAMLKGMREDGRGLGGIPSKVADVRVSTKEITSGLTKASNSVLDDLEKEIDVMGDEMAADRDAQNLADTDVDVMIEKYTTVDVAVGKPRVVVD
ncbi:MAG: hypothetical protein ACOCWV_02530 [Planctomycetota bacterium]